MLRNMLIHTKHLFHWFLSSEGCVTYKGIQIKLLLNNSPNMEHDEVVRINRKLTRIYFSRAVPACRIILFQK